MTAKKSRSHIRIYLQNAFILEIYLIYLARVVSTLSNNPIPCNNIFVNPFFFPWKYDWLIIWCFTPYRQYFIHITAAWKYVHVWLQMHKFPFWSGSFLLPFTPFGGSTRLHWEVSLNTIQVACRLLILKNQNTYTTIYSKH